MKYSNSLAAFLLLAAFAWPLGAPARDIGSGDLDALFGGNDSGNINLTGNVYWDSAYGPNNNRVITIYGNGRTITVNNYAYINATDNNFTFSLSNAIVNNTWGTYRGDYGLFRLYNNNGTKTLNFDGVTFQNFRAANGEASGSVLDVWDGRATVNVGAGGLVIRDSIATGDASAVGIFDHRGNSAGSLTFNGPGTVKFLNNSTQNYGGAMSVSSDGLVAFNADAVFEGNWANNFGGAIDVWGYSGTLRFSGSTLFQNNFIYNTGNAQDQYSRGGAINIGFINGNEVVRFDGVTSFIGNHVITTAGSGNRARAYGGALSGMSNETNARYSYQFNNAVLFRDNFVYSANGEASGGALYFSIPNSSISFAPGSEFTNNYAKNEGGALYFDSGNITFNASDAGNILFQGNRKGASYTGSGTGIKPVAGSGSPSAVYISGNATLNLNATGTGKIEFNDPITTGASSAATVNKTGAGSVVFSNGANDLRAFTNVQGGLFQLINGAGYGVAGSGTITANSGTLAGEGGSILKAARVNVSTGAGGAAWANAGLFIMQTGNFVLGANGALGGSGTLRVTDAAGNLTSITTPSGGGVFFVEASKQGERLGTMGAISTGSLWVASTFTGGGQLVKRGLGTYVSNLASGHTGGTIIREGTFLASVPGANPFAGLGTNTAAGVRFDGPASGTARLLVINNATLPLRTTITDGAAGTIESAGSQLIITTPAYAAGSGGAIYGGANSTLDLAGNIRLAGNRTTGASGHGGAVYLGAGARVNLRSSYADILFNNNAAGGDGGAIYANGDFTLGSAILAGGASLFTSNTAAARGGAIYTTGGFALVLDSGSLVATGNKAGSGNAGGGFLYAGGGTARFDIAAGAVAAIGDASSLAGQADSIAGGAGVGLAKTGGGLLTLWNSSSLGGNATITGGTLALNGILANAAAAIGSTGRVAVSAGGLWKNSGALTVGNSGDGQLLVSGGTVTSASGAIGGAAAASGVVGVSGGGLWQNTGALTVGSAGSLGITGGTVTAATGAISAGGSVSVSAGGLLQHTGGLTVGSDGALSIAGGGVSTGGMYAQGAGGNLALSLIGRNAQDAFITAQSATLSGTLAVSGYNPSGGASVRASDLGIDAILVRTSGGISGDFSVKTGIGAAASLPDYLLAGAFVSGTNYVLGTQLNWYAGGTGANGLFTVGAGDSFDVDVSLAGVAANSAKAWNGQRLIKAGEGELVLSGSNNYGGLTEVYGGTLAITGRTGGNGGDIRGGIVTVGGSGHWNLTGGGDASSQLAIGIFGAGTLAINGGTVAASGGAMLGQESSGAGAATVNGGLWSINKNLVAGVAGAGVVTLASGTVLVRGDSIVSDITGSSGAAVITGGLWDARNNFTINGAGALTLSGGTLATGGTGVIAGGLATINGGGLWSPASLGNTSGTLAIAGSGSAAVGGGYAQGAGGVLGLDLAGGARGAFITAQSATLGGALTVSNYTPATGVAKASQLSVGQVLIHTTNGITGDFATKTGVGAASAADYFFSGAFKLGNDYVLGSQLVWFGGTGMAHGNFTVAPGGVFDLDVALADQSGLGSFTSGWDGKSLTLTAANSGTLKLTAANTHTGVTNVLGGALLLAGGTGSSVGKITAGDSALIDGGTATVSATAWWNIRDNGAGGRLAIGDGGLSIARSGSVTVQRDAVIGEAADTYGTVAVNGGRLNVGEDFILGASGTGALALTGSSSSTSGTVAVTGSTIIGSAAGGVGIATVSNYGHLSAGQTLVVGGSGTGVLALGASGRASAGAGGVIIGNGGTGSGEVLIDDGRLTTTGHIYLGQSFGATGRLTLAGSGAADSAGDFVLGVGGAGALSIENDGRLTTGGAATLGYAGSGTAVIRDGGLWTVAGGFLNGSSGRGALTIQDTGSLTVAGAFTQDAASELDLRLGATRGQFITAQSATLAGKLTVTNFNESLTGTTATQIMSKNVLLIRTQNGFTGDFGTKVIGTPALRPDFITLTTFRADNGVISATGTDYMVGFNLSWFTGTATAHGNFTLPAGIPFENPEADIPITDQSSLGTFASGWDGKSVTITAANVANFVFSNNNTYTGNTLVLGGTLTISGTTRGADGRVGTQTGGRGSVVVSGLWDAASLTVGGMDATGFLAVRPGGSVLMSGSIAIGQGGSLVPVATGTALVEGLMQAGGNLVVGRYGSGALAITGTVRGANTLIGDQQGAGSVNLAAGSLQTGTLTVGNGGAATLNLAAAATADSTRAIIGATGSAAIAGLWRNTGDLALSGTAAAALNLAATGTLANTGAATLAADSSAVIRGLWSNTGGITAAGKLAVLGASGSVRAGGAYASGPASALTLDASGRGLADAFITAASATVGGTITLSNFTPAGGAFADAQAVRSSDKQVLITATAATGTISGYFASGTITGYNPAGLPDYLHGGIYKTADAKQYVAGIDLRWLGDAADGNGRFTLAGGSSFDVNVALADRTGVAFASGWDGKSLTVTSSNAGLLTLSANNTHTGTTTVNGGTLAITGTTTGNAEGVIAQNTGDTATVRVSGTGYWGMTGDLTVGRSGSGWLYIADRARVSVGGNALVDDAYGYVSVGGTGRFDITGGLTVGNDGVGELVNAGTVTVGGDSIIGNSAGATGTAAVNGAGRWDTAGSLHVGKEGAGVLLLSQNARVSSGTVRLGSENGASGSGTVGGSAFWDAGGAFHVGDAGAGALTLAGSGSIHVAGAAGIGSEATGSGTAAVGDSARWNIDSQLRVGDAGSGALTIAERGRVASDGGYIGATGSGAVAISGSGFWDTGRELRVGDAGAGVLTLAGSGSLLTGGTAFIGHAAGATGAVTLGGNALLSAAALHNGRDGSASLIMRDDARITVAGTYAQNAASLLDIHLTGTRDAFVTAQSATLGGSLVVTGFTGTITGTTATQLMANHVYLFRTNNAIEGDFSSKQIGINGAPPDFITPTAYKSSGGIISATGTNYVVGFNLSWLSGTATAHGDFTIVPVTSYLAFDVDHALGDEAGVFASGWDGKSLTVTSSNIGLLTLSASNTYTGTTTVNGGTLAITGWTGGNTAGVVGGSAATNGHATVTGTWAMDNLHVGRNSGTGALVIDANGLVDARAAAYVGRGAGATGTLTVAAGGTLTGATAYIGAGGGFGTASVTGAWRTDELVVGSSSGTGVLAVSAGGRLVTGTHAYLGGRQGADAGNGSVTLSQNALWTVGGNLYNDQPGTGRFTILDSGSVTVGGTYFQGAGSSLDLYLNLARGAYVTAESAVIGGDVSVLGFSGTVGGMSASSLVGSQQTIIRTTTGTIAGEFTSVGATGTTTAMDYLMLGAFKTPDSREYKLGYGLVWYSGTGRAHGNFTLNAGESFDMDEALNAVAAPNASGWDGKSITLTAANRGVLALSASNNYSGTTTVNGGTLAISDWTGANAAGVIGAAAATDGAVLVSGTGLWGMSGGLAVGGSGAGSLTVNGGTVAVAGHSQVGNASTATGSATVNGGLWTTGGTLYVGTDGTGALTVAGGAVRAAALSAGASAGSSGAVTIGGGLLDTTDNINIGAGGAGSLAVTGGTLRAGADLLFGLNGAVGTGSIGGNGLALAGGNVVVGGNGGNGSLAIAGSGSVSATGTYAQNAASTLTLALGGARGAFVTAQSATLSGALIVDGFTGTTSGTKASEAVQTARVLIRAGNAIAGDFDSKTIHGGTSAFDYLVFNTYASGTDYVLGTQLAWNSGTALGHGDFTVASGKFEVDTALADQAPAAGGWDGASLLKAGSGTLVLSATNTHTGNTTVAAGMLVLATPANNSAAALGASDLDIQAGGTARIAPGIAGNFTLSNAVAGEGLFEVSLAGPSSTLAISNNLLTFNFNGAARLSDSVFTLADDHFINATLVSATGNRVIVSAGTNALAGLVLDGGRVDFDTNVPADITSPAFIDVTGTLHLASGTIGVRVPQGGASTAVSQAPLLRQDDGALTKLAASATTTGQTANLRLWDLNTSALVSATQSAAINQAGTHVATGTYGYGLATADASGSNGLYVSYGLRAVDILAGRTLLLDGDTAAPGGSDEFHATIGGSGNLALAATNAITLNAANTYTGTTTITSGTVIAGVNAALGNTARLALAGVGAAFDLNGKAQTIGALDTAAATRLDLAGGTLAVTNGGSIAGALAGTGSLGLGGLVDITSANAAFAASVGVTGTTRLADVAALGNTGTATVAANAELALTSATGALAKTIAGAGNITVGASLATPATSSSVTLTAANTAFTGTWTIAPASALSASSTANLGTADILFDGMFTVTNATAETLGNALSGSGTLVKQNTGNLTISQSNAFTGATTIAGGTLTLENLHGIGAGAVSNNSILDLAAAGDFANNIAGTGTTRVTNNAAVALTGTNTVAAWRIDAGAAATVAQQQNLGAGATRVDGLLDIAAAAPWNYVNTLAGTGTLQVGLGNSANAFAFAATTGSAFQGTVALASSSFALSGNNTAALKNATLRLDAGNRTTVGAGTQQIAGLAIDGGRVDFDTNVPADLTSPAFIDVTGTLDLASGTIGVRVPTGATAYTAPQAPLLQQDDGALTKLASSATTTGNIGGIALLDLNTGALVSATQSAAINQSGARVATGTYGYGLATADAAGANGLYVSYGLLAVDILAGQTLLLDGDTTASGGSEFHARIAGAGNLALAATNAITLAAANTYTGTTTITSGTVIAGVNAALGNTARLALAAAGAAFDLNGKAQTVGALDTAANTRLDLAGGTLAVTNGGTVGGALAGAGTLALGGLAGITTSNAAFAASVGVTGTTTLRSTQALGDTGTLDAAGRVRLENATGALAKTIAGTGTVALAGSSSVALTATNALHGQWRVAQNTALSASSTANLSDADILFDGMFTVANATAETLGNRLSGSGTLVKAAAGTLTISQSNAFAGRTLISAGTLALQDLGGAGAGGITNNAALELAAAGVFANNINGTGTTRVTAGAAAAPVTLAGANQTAWNITGAARVSATANLGAGATRVDGLLDIAAAAPWNYVNALAGTGTLQVGLGNSANAFAFAATAGNAFQGTVALASSSFALSGNNTAALKNATLRLDAGNRTTVGAGTQQIANLAIDGGRMDFDTNVPADITSPAFIDVTGTLHLASGTIGVRIPQAGASTAVSQAPLLRQDDGALTRLAASATTTGQTANLRLWDLNTSALVSATQSAAINQAGTHVATGTYGYGLATADASGTNGLYVSYGLRAVDILAGRTLLLDGDTAAPGGSEFLARIGGSGNLALAATNAITLNAANTYTGTTTVTSGTVIAGVNAALGSTARLALAGAGAAFDLNGKAQTVGALDTAANTRLELAGGTLAVTNTGANSSAIAGALAGTGSLGLGGRVDITGANAAFAASVGVTGTTRLADVAALGNTGAATVAAGAELALINATGALAKTIAGAGAVALVNTSSVAVTATNSTFSGTWNIAAATALGASGTANLGPAAIVNNGKLTLANTAAETLSNALSGSGTFIKTGAGNLTISQSNAFTGDTIVAGGTLTLQDLHGIGTSDITNNATLDIDTGGTFANNLLGTGTTIINPDVILTGSNTLTKWDITGTATATVNSQQNLGSAATNIDGRLNITATTGWNYANALTGTGRLGVDLASSGNAFAFAAATGSAFQGTVALASSSFALSGSNTAALKNATLQLDAGNRTTVGTGTQQIGNLVLNGGTLGFALASSGSAAGVIKTAALDIQDTVIRIDTTGFTSAGGSPLLQQDDGQAIRLIDSAGLAPGSKTVITGTQLIDQTGAQLGAATQSNIVQGGATTASGTYDFAAFASGSGLALDYTLVALDLRAGQTTVLNNDLNNAVLAGADALVATVTGSGNLRIDATGSITLRNTANAYTGTTTVTRGTLVTDSDSALGRTARLVLNAATVVELNNTAQTVVALDTASSSRLDLGTGALAVTNGGTVAGALAGTGSLGLGGRVDITGPNAAFAASVGVTGTTTLRHTQALGDTGAAAVTGALVLDRATGAFAKTIAGDGAVSLVGTSSVALTAANTAFSGTWAIAAATALDAAGTANLGAAAIVDNGKLTLANTAAETFSNALSGSGTLVKTAAGNLTISQSNAFTGATTISGGTLTLENLHGIGAGAVSNNSILDLAATGAFSNNIAGSGTTFVTGNAAVALTGTNTVAALRIDAGAAATVTRQQNLGSGRAQIDGLLDIAATIGWNHANALAGTGTLRVDLGNSGNALAFAAATGNAFQGTVALASSSFALSGNNTAALRNATLRLDAGNRTTVGAGAQQIGALALNGGRIDFGATIPADITSPSLVQAGALDIDTWASGTVGVNLPGLNLPAAVPQLPLLRQDEGSAGTQLVSAAVVTGNVNSLKLVDNATGAQITNAKSAYINQSGQTVANGTYDYGLTDTGTQGSGLYVTYRLTAVDLLANRALTLGQDAPAPAGADNFTARIGGAGSLVIDAVGSITLTDAANSYTGTTTVARGALVAGNDHVLGNTARLALTGAAAAFDLNGKTQAVGAVDTAANSRLELNGGALTIAAGGVINGSLNGAGSLALTGGSLALTTANTGFTAATTIAAPATARITSASGLGSAAITLDGTLQVDTVASGALQNTLAGAGRLHKTGAGSVTIASANTGFNGRADIDAGTLAAARLDSLGVAGINVAAGATFEQANVTGTLQNALTGNGAHRLAGSAITLANASAYGIKNTILDAGSELRLAASGLRFGALHLNGGKLLFATAQPNAAATIDTLGNGGGEITMRVQLDRLVPGVTTAGLISDHLTIANSGGGAHSVFIDTLGTQSPWIKENMAVELITVNSGNADFTLANPGGRIESGFTAFELLQGDGSAHTPLLNKWYLTDRNISHAADAILNTANTLALDWAFALDSLHLRLGDLRSEAGASLGAAVAGSRKPRGNLWMRGRGYGLSAKNDISGLPFKQYSWGLTAGMDLAFQTDTGASLIGLFADTGMINRDFDNGGAGETRSSSFGAYITLVETKSWFVNAIARLDNYTNEFDARAVGDDRVIHGGYKTKGASLSVETGWYRVIRNDGWWIEPSVQAAILRLDGKDYATDPAPGLGAISVRVADSETLQYRARVRFGRQLKDSKWYPYGKFGVAGMNSSGGEIESRDGSPTTLKADFDGVRVEFGFGTSYRVSDFSQVYLDYEYSMSGKYQRPWGINLGYRRLW
ncbi:hypothetical protein AW736_02760 [Termitidicoccus mucosus]|uniref:Autotransporter domain-containing protein n=1 Tax=Termitidicoccus mucosus TaxID=1184151 RepID=A0A178IP06_9BACT|nr:hypothetical protein AW736_02760 [Opitutaceae bacterium TSB47]